MNDSGKIAANKLSEARGQHFPLILKPQNKKLVRIKNICVNYGQHFPL